MKSITLRSLSLQNITIYSFRYSMMVNKFLYLHRRGFGSVLRQSQTINSLDSALKIFCWVSGSIASGNSMDREFNVKSLKIISFIFWKSSRFRIKIRIYHQNKNCKRSLQIKLRVSFLNINLGNHIYSKKCNQIMKQIYNLFLKALNSIKRFPSNLII